LNWLRSQWYALLDWLQGLADNHPVGYNLLLWGAVALLLLILAHVGYVVWRILKPTARTARVPAGGAPVIHDAAGHLARAEALARAGKFAEALGHRFLAVVFQLEQRDVLKFHASKTPAEYLGELRLDESGRSTFASLVARLYRHLFGAVPCDEVEYRAFGDVAEALVMTRGRGPQA
jgi:hypothetical protein